MAMLVETVRDMFAQIPAASGMLSPRSVPAQAMGQMWEGDWEGAVQTTLDTLQLSSEDVCRKLLVCMWTKATPYTLTDLKAMAVEAYHSLTEGDIDAFSKQARAGLNNLLDMLTSTRPVCAVPTEEMAEYIRFNRHLSDKHGLIRLPAREPDALHRAFVQSTRHPRHLLFPDGMKLSIEDAADFAWANQNEEAWKKVRVIIPA